MLSTVSFSLTPQARDDAGVVLEDGIVLLNVMQNDLGGNAKALFSVTASAESALLVPTGSGFSQLGALVQIVDGKILYDARGAATLNALAAGETAVDTFLYAIRLGNGTISIAQVSLTVTGANDAPVVEAADVTGGVTEAVVPAGDLVDTGSIAFSDFDLSDVHTVGPVTASEGALGSLAASMTSDTTGAGTGGSVTWTYSVAATAVEYLAAGETKVESFSFTLDDGHGGAVERTVQVTITGTNDGPVVAAGDVTGTVEEAGVATGTLTNAGSIAFSDVDLSDVHTVGAVAASAGALGSLTATLASDTTGTGAGGSIAWSYSVDAAAVEFLAAGETKTESFSFTLSDGNGGTVERTVEVTITGTNDGPLVAAEDLAGAVVEAGPAAGTLIDSGTIAFSDLDLADVHVVGPVTASPGALGSLEATLAADTTGSGSGGSIAWSYSLDAGAAEYLAAGETKTESFSFTLSDGNGGSVERTVEVTITGTNDGPLITSEELQGFVSEGLEPDGDFVTGGLILFEDLDRSDIHTVGAVAASAGALGTVTAEIGLDTTGSGTGGVLVWNYTVAAAALEYLSAGETRSETFTFSLDDGHGGTVERTVQVTIVGSNDAPVITSEVLAGSVVEGDAPGTLSTSGAIAFTDVDLIDGHVVGAVQPAAGALGSLVVIIAADTAGAGTTGEVTWEYTVDAAAVEHLAAGEERVERFTLTVADLFGASLERTVEVRVTGTNDGPVITAEDVSGQVEEAGTPAGVLTDAGTMAFSDADLTDSHAVGAITASPGALGALTVAIVTDTTGTGGGGSVAWSYSVDASAVEYLAEGETKTESFTFTLDDGNGGSVERTVSVTITGTNDGPVAAADANAVVEAGVSVAGDPVAAGNVLANDTDADVADSMAVAMVNGAGTAVGQVVAGTYGSVVIHADGSYTYTLDNADADTQALAQGASASDVFSYTVVDAAGATSTANLTIAIAGSNDAPVGVDDNNAGDPVVEQGQGVPGDNRASGNVLANDTDVDAGATRSVSAVAGGPVGGTIQGTYGSLVMASNGSYTYTLDNADPDTNGLAAGAQGVENFSYTVSDEFGATSTATLAIRVTGSNDAPVAVADSNAGDAVIEAGVGSGNVAIGDPTAQGNVLANDTDADNGATRTVAAVNGQAANVGGTVVGVYGNLVIAANGSYTYTLNNATPATNALAQGAAVTDNFSYTVRDNAGATATAQLAITINGSNDAPVAANDTNSGGTVAATKLVGAKVAVFDNGAVVDTAGGAGSESDTIQATLTSLGHAVSTFTGYDAASLAAALAGKDVLVLPEQERGDWGNLLDAAGKAVIRDFVANGGAMVVSCDRQGTLNEIFGFAIQTTGSQSSIPKVTAATSGTTFAATAGSVSNLSFTDAVSLASLPAGSVSMYGTATTSSVTVIPFGSGQITRLGWDWYNAAPLGSVDGGWRGVLDAAISKPGGSMTEAGIDAGGVPVAGNTVATGNVLANDTDVDTPAMLAVVGVGAATGNVGTVVTGTYGTLVVNANGSYTYTLDNTDSDTNALAQDAVAADVFTYTVADQVGATSTATVTINIVGTNDAPVITSVAQMAAVAEVTDGAPSENATTHVRAGTMAFSDADAGGTHSATVAAQGSGYLGTLLLGVVDQGGDTVAWNFSVQDSALDALQAGQTLTQTYAVTVTDALGVTATQNVVVTLTGSNDAPLVVTMSTEVFDFESLTGGTLNGIFPEYESVIEGGYRLAGVGDLGWGVSALSPSNPLLATYGYNTPTGSTTMHSPEGASIARVDGALFGVKSIDLDHLRTNFDEGAGPVTFVGVRADGSTVQATFTIDQIRGLQTCNFGSDFSSIKELRFPPGSVMQFDNVVLTTASNTSSPPPVTFVVSEVADGAPGENTVNHVRNGSLSFIDADQGDAHAVTITPAGSAYLGTLSAVLDGTGRSLNWNFTVNDLALDALGAGENRVQSYDIELTDASGASFSQTLQVTLQGMADGATVASGMVSGQAVRSISQFSGIGIDSVTGKYYVSQGYGMESTNTVTVYSNAASFESGAASGSIVLGTYDIAGTYFTGWNGMLIGRTDESSMFNGWPDRANLGKWHASTGALVTTSQPIPGMTGINGSGTFDWGGFSGVNTLQDDTGIYVLGKGTTSTQWEVAKINPVNLAVMEVKTFSGVNSLGYAFAVDGHIFLGDTFHSPHIGRVFDYENGTLESANITLGVGFDYIYNVAYDSTSDSLYVASSSTLYEVTNASDWLFI